MTCLWQHYITDFSCILALYHFLTESQLKPCANAQVGTKVLGRTSDNVEYLCNRFNDICHVNAPRVKCKYFCHKAVYTLQSERFLGYSNIIQNHSHTCTHHQPFQSQLQYISLIQIKVHIILILKIWYKGTLQHGWFTLRILWITVYIVHVL